MLEDLRKRSIKSMMVVVIVFIMIGVCMLLGRLDMFVVPEKEIDIKYILICAGVMALGIIPALIGVKGAKLRYIKEFLQEVDDYDRTLAELEEMYNYEPEKGYYFSSKYIIDTTRVTSPQIYRTTEVIWIYQNIIYSRRFAVPKSYGIVLAFRDGKKIEVVYPIIEEADKDKMLNKLYELVPYACYAWSRELEDVFENSRERMINHVDSQMAKLELEHKRIW